MKKMIRIVKNHRDMTLNAQEKVDEMKFEVGDSYVRRYLQKIKLDQTDKSLNLLDRMLASSESQRLNFQIEKVAKYCTVVHTSAYLFKIYDNKYGKQTAENTEEKTAE